MPGNLALPSPVTQCGTAHPPFAFNRIREINSISERLL